MTRRRALRLTASSSIIGLTGPDIVGAVGNDGSREFVGVSYDPLTHVAQDEATARLKSIDGALKGTLNVGGFEIPIGQEKSLERESRESRVSAYSFATHEPKFTKDELPLYVRFMNFGPSISGTLTRPNPNYGRLAFTLKPSDTKGGASKVRSGLIGGGNGRPGAPKKPMVKNGIPPRYEPQLEEE